MNKHFLRGEKQKQKKRFSTPPKKKNTKLKDSCFPSNSPPPRTPVPNDLSVVFSEFCLERIRREVHRKKKLQEKNGKTLIFLVI